jgi:hypothetical protein
MVALLSKVPIEKRIELVVRSVYEDSQGGPGGTEVIPDSVRDVIPEPPGGWTCQVDIDGADGRQTLTVIFDGENYTDTVTGDRTDAADTYTPPDEDDTDPKPWPL